MFIKKEIKTSNIDKNIKFSLDLNNKTIGHQQDINTFINESIENSINPINDNEIRRFKYEPTAYGNIFAIKFYFFMNEEYRNYYTYAGFTESEINNYDDVLRNSFFIFDVYDSYDENIQTKIATTYLTKLITYNSGVASVHSSFIISKYDINQFYYLNIPIWYMYSDVTYSRNLYGKFSFYNAKTGKLTLFYNYEREDDNNNKKEYFDIEVDLVNKTWGIRNLASNNLAEAVQYKPTSPYVKKINNAVDNFVKMKQVYPDGNNFDTTKLDYTTE